MTNMSQDFIGTIDSYDSESKSYKVSYEDGDVEDLNMKELLVLIEKH